jgi:3-oxoacyl-(acyl-carrier-protein) synthase
VSDVFIASDNIITSLGFTTIENARNMLAGNTGIRLREDKHIAPSPFYASLIDSAQLHSGFSLIDDPDLFSRFEQMSVCSIKNALSGTEIDCADPKAISISLKVRIKIDMGMKEFIYGVPPALSSAFLISGMNL